MNITRALAEIDNMNDPESGNSALDDDELLKAATVIAAEVRMLWRLLSAEQDSARESVTKLRAKLAHVEAEIEFAERARDRFDEMGMPDNVGLLNGVIKRFRAALKGES